MVPKGRTPQFTAEAIGGFLGRPVSPTHLGFPQQAPRPVTTRALTYGEDVGETLHTLAELGSTDISRRSPLRAVPFVASAPMDPQRKWLLWLLEEEQAPHLAAVAGGSPVDQMEAMIDMFDLMDNRFGGGNVRPSIIGYLSTQLVPMLQQRNLPSNQRRTLYVYAAKLTATAGWCSYDTADYGLAERYMIQALRLTLIHFRNSPWSVSRLLTSPAGGERSRAVGGRRRRRPGTARTRTRGRGRPAPGP